MIQRIELPGASATSSHILSAASRIGPGAVTIIRYILEILIYRAASLIDDRNT
jgi:hypothetical protein